MNTIDVYFKIENEETIIYDTYSNSIGIYAKSLEEANLKLVNIKSLQGISNIDFLDSNQMIISDEKTRLLYFKKILISKLEVTKLEINSDDKNTIDLLNKYSSSLNTLDFGHLDILKIKDILKELKLNDNIRFVTKYNYYDDCSKEEFEQLYEYLKNIYNYVARFNLSPLEICIFVYDLIREKKYQFSQEDLLRDDKFSEDIEIEKIIENNKLAAYSRSLFKIYNTDNIVCTGYARMYSAILNMFGIITEEIDYCSKDKFNFAIAEDEKSSGHTSNIVYLVDKKYNENVIIEVDPTWGIISNDDESINFQETMENYCFFGRTIKAAKKHKDVNNLTADSNASSSVGHVIKIINRLKKTINMNVQAKIISYDVNALFDEMNNINKKINSPKIINAISLLEKIKTQNNCNSHDYLELLINNLDSIESSLYGSINPVNFACALDNVKMIEHSIDSHKYLYNSDLSLRAVRESYNIKDEKVKEIMRPFILKKLLTSEKEELQKSRMELISVFHKIASDDVQSNPILIKTSKK